MKCVLILISICSVVFGYGYWDILEDGARVMSLTPFSAASGGATHPEKDSAFPVFTNPSGLAGLSRSSLSFSGWGRGWREEVYYDYWCTDAYRFSKGGMSPRGSLAFAFPVGKSLTVGAGIATVSQYEMLATVQVYHEVSENNLQVLKTLTADGSGDQHEALLSLAGEAGIFKLGISSGIRFGSGEATIYSNRVESSQFDSTFHQSWEISELAFRAGASARFGYTDVYSTFVNGGERYKSYIAVGSAASFPFLNGGLLGTELALLSGNEIKAMSFIKAPWIIPGANGMVGITGYRPENAYKMGMGLSCGLEYTFGSSRFTGVYSWNSRYREGVAVPIEYINWMYDSGESFMVGFEQNF